MDEAMKLSIGEIVRSGEATQVQQCDRYATSQAGTLKDHIQTHSLNANGTISLQSRSHSLPNICSTKLGRRHITSKSADQYSGEFLDSRPCVENYESRRRALCISPFAFVENHSIVGAKNVLLYEISPELCFSSNANVNSN